MLKGEDVEDPRDKAVDIRFCLNGFKCANNRQLLWSGLRLANSDVTLPVYDDDFVDVYVRYCSTVTGEITEEKRILPKPPRRDVLVSDGSYSFSLQDFAPADKTLYVSAIILQPYHTYKEDLIPFLAKGLASIAHFDEYGNYIGSLDVPSYTPGTMPEDTFHEDFFLPDFHTGIGWLDTLLNSWVDFINAILKAIYNIRNLLFRRDGVGIFQLLERMAYYVTHPVEFSKVLWEDFREVFSSLMEFLFVPDPAFIHVRVESLMERFSWAELVFGFGERILDLLSSSSGTNPPVIKVDFSNYEGAFSYGSAVVVIDFAWYARFKPYVDAILSGIIWVTFLWHLYKRLPDIIRGAGMSTVHLFDAPRSEIEKPAPDSADIFFDRLMEESRAESKAKADLEADRRWLSNIGLHK